ncbi:MAG: hypothetical protein KA419_08455 [Acidobacteria bacterium]|nr:hypothetical protein [Acidobacteriota bacterium]
MLLKNETPRKTIRRSLTLPEEIFQDIDLYARAIDSSPNWVVSQILAKFFVKDREFLEWKEFLRSSAEQPRLPVPGNPKPAREKDDPTASS